MKESLIPPALLSNIVRCLNVTDMGGICNLCQSFHLICDPTPWNYYGYKKYPKHLQSETAFFLAIRLPHGESIRVLAQEMIDSNDFNYSYKSHSITLKEVSFSWQQAGHALVVLANPKSPTSGM